MTTATLAYNIQRGVQSKIDAIDLPNINWKRVCFAGFFLALGLLIFYVWQINSLTAGFYTINTYQKEISKLSEENKNLQISFAESSFLGQALQKISDMNFQKTTSVKYIKMTGSPSQVAKADKN